jgi:hypothetical protein
LEDLSKLLWLSAVDDGTGGGHDGAFEFDGGGIDGD